MMAVFLSFTTTSSPLISNSITSKYSPFPSSSQLYCCSNGGGGGGSGNFIGRRISRRKTVGRNNNIPVVKCENQVSSDAGADADKTVIMSTTTTAATTKKLEIGSPIIVVEAPKMLKTADSIPCLRANSGLVNPGDVGRIVSRKPKDVWAVRLTIGTYLIDGKYFKPLDFDD